MDHSCQQKFALSSCVALGMGLLFLPTEAKADGIVVGLEAGYIGTVEINDRSLPSDGSGAVGLRGGYEFGLGLIYLRPELGATWAFFPSHTDTRIYAGGRAGLTTFISPAVYAHIGHGWYNPNQHASFDGFTYDFGAALDLRLPLVTIGAHLGLEMNPDVAPAWLRGGLHGELRF